MGNSTSKAPAPSSSSSSKRRSSSGGGGKSGGKGGGTSASAGGPANNNKPQDLSSRAQQMVGDSYRDLQLGIQSGIKKLEEQDHPAAQLLDSICSPYLDHKGSFYSSDNDNDSHTVSEDETTDTYNNHNSRSRRKGGGGGGGGGGRNDDRSMGEGESYVSNSDYESVDVSKPSHSGGGGGGTHHNHHRPIGSNSKQAKESTDDDESEQIVPAVHHSKKPLASSFAKRCFFTKAGIGGQTQHYEGLTLTGNVVLMLAQAMKLKGCPTICDEDLRRVEQTYPNQFSRLPDELLLSSGWRRISKYCHFSNKPIPDGIPFFREYPLFRCFPFYRHRRVV